MKKLLRFIFFLSVPLLGSAQYNPGKIYVVYDADMFSDFNFSLNDAVKKNWELCPFEWLTYDLFVKKISSAESVFLFLSESQFELYGRSFKLLTLNLSKGSADGKIGNMKDLAIFPLATSHENCEDYCFKLPLAVRFLQAAIQSPDYNTVSNISEVEKLQTLVRSPENIRLCFSKSQLSSSLRNENEITDFYHGPIKILSQSELVKKIESADNKQAFLQLLKLKNASKSYVLKILISGDGRTLYYFRLSPIKNSRDQFFNEEDFKKLKL